MTPTERALLRALALATLAPGSGVLRDGVREALAGLDAEAAREVNAPRPPADTVAARAAVDPEFREEIESDPQAINIEITSLGDDEWFWRISNETGEVNVEGIAPSLADALAHVNAEVAEIPRLPTSEQCGGYDTMLATSAPATDTVVAEVRAKFLSRSEDGIAKYGTTLDRADLGPREWLEHLRQELMDAVLYATRAMRDLPTAVPTEPLQAAGPELRQEALNGSPPVYVLAGSGRHPYGDDAYYLMTDGVRRIFPDKAAAQAWLKAMGRVPV
jgi:hypothetical protein